MGGAPPIPGLAKAPAPPGLAPPVPGNRARSNSDQVGGARDSIVVSSEPAPQLAGIFAGGMPKLKKRGGGVNTGGMPIYLSIPQHSLTMSIHHC